MYPIAEQDYAQTDGREVGKWVSGRGNVQEYSMLKKVQKSIAEILVHFPAEL